MPSHKLSLLVKIADRDPKGKVGSKIGAACYNTRLVFNTKDTLGYST